MELQKLNEIFTSDFNLDSLLAHRQTWGESGRFSSMEQPRRSNGLFLLTDYPARYELESGETLWAEPGDVILLPKGARYVVSLSVPDGKQAHPIIINFGLSTPGEGECSLGTQVTRLCRDRGGLQGLFSAAAQLYINASPAKLKAKVYELIDEIFPLGDADECCISYINRHYTGRFSVPELARRCGMSETVYRKRFRQITGCSPVQYINRLKVEKACQMLLGGDIGNREISEFLNFYSLPYFYKVFRDCTGQTPNAFRDQQEER